MTYETTRVKLSYEFYKTVPEDNAAYQDYEDFKAIFGEEGNVLFLGIQSERFFELDYFNDWCALEKSIKEIEDVESTLSVPSTYNLVKNIAERRFDIQPLVVNQPKTQAELDSIKNDFLRLPFYKDRIYSPDSNTYVMQRSIELAKKDFVNQ